MFIVQCIYQSFVLLQVEAVENITENSFKCVTVETVIKYNFVLRI